MVSSRAFQLPAGWDSSCHHRESQKKLKKGLARGQPGYSHRHPSSSREWKMVWSFRGWHLGDEAAKNAREMDMTCQMNCRLGVTSGEKKQQTVSWNSFLQRESLFCKRTMGPFGKIKCQLSMAGSPVLKVNSETSLEPCGGGFCWSAELQLQSCTCLCGRKDTWESTEFT